jgi:hypothetical protein
MPTVRGPREPDACARFRSAEGSRWLAWARCPRQAPGTGNQAPYADERWTEQGRSGSRLHHDVAAGLLAPHAADASTTAERKSVSAPGIAILAHGPCVVELWLAGRAACCGVQRPCRLASYSRSAAAKAVNVRRTSSSSETPFALARALSALATTSSRLCTFRSTMVAPWDCARKIGLDPKWGQAE